MWHTNIFVRSVAVQVNVNATGCGFDSHSKKWHILCFFFLADSGKFKCINGNEGHYISRFPLPTPLCAGYSVKLKE